MHQYIVRRKCVLPKGLFPQVQPLTYLLAQAFHLFVFIQVYFIAALALVSGCLHLQGHFHAIGCLLIPPRMA